MIIMLSKIGVLIMRVLMTLILGLAQVVRNVSRQPQALNRYANSLPFA